MNWWQLLACQNEEKRVLSLCEVWSCKKSYFLLGEKYKFVNARDILGSSNHHLLISQDKKSLLFEKGATLDGYKKLNKARNLNANILACFLSMCDKKISE